MTAEAVKSSLERTFAKNNRAKTFFNYTEITANGQELTIKTDKPYYNLPSLLGDPLFLIVDVTSEANGRNFAKEGPIGTGPYVVESFTKERAELKRNDNYWDGKVGLVGLKFHPLMMRIHGLWRCNPVMWIWRLASDLVNMGFSKMIRISLSMKWHPCVMYLFG